MAESYVLRKMGVVGRVREARNLYHMHADELTRKTAEQILRLHQVEDEVQNRFNLQLEGLRMLDVGPGQTLPQMGYFSIKNDVIGIDLDIVPQGWNPLPYLKMLTVNGAARTAKTLARKILRLDARVYAEMQRQLGARFRNLRVIQMDATKMAFPPNHFDFVYSIAAFEHLPNPGAVIERVAEVLRPGGVAYLSLHPYTCESGAHDVRILSGNRSDLPYWAHLRPHAAHLIQSNTYLNRLRIDEWKAIFSEHLPGCEFIARQFCVEQFVPLIKEIRARGELEGFTDDELLTAEFICVWRKACHDREHTQPAQSGATAAATGTALRVQGVSAPWLQTREPRVWAAVSSFFAVTKVGVKVGVGVARV